MTITMKSRIAAALAGLLPTCFAFPLQAQCTSWEHRFGVDGVGRYEYEPRVGALATFDDGTGPALYLGGEFDTSGNELNQNFARWNGSEWMPGGNVSGSIFALASHDDGTGAALYVGGNLISAGGIPVDGIARWNGSTFAPVGLGVLGSVTALAVHDEGSGPRLFAGRNWVGVARWDGTSWTDVGFGPSGGAVWALESHDDGSGPALYAAGAFTAGRISRWNGTNWSSVGGGIGGPSAIVNALCSFDDGSGPALFAGGAFTTAGGTPVSNIARWNGSTWSGVGAGFDGQILGLAVHSEAGVARLFAVGVMNSSGGTTTKRIARWDGATWSAVGAGLEPNGTMASALCEFDAGSGPALFAGGSFSRAGNLWVSGIARWKDSTWSKLPASPPGRGIERGLAEGAAVIASGPQAGLYATGMQRAGGVGLPGTGKWDGSTWSPVGSQPLYGFALASHDAGNGPELYATGGPGNLPPGLSTIARWDGAVWQPVGTGLSGTGYVLHSHDLGSGHSLFVGGSVFIAGQLAYGIAQWNGATWSALGAGLDSWTPLALAGYDDGSGPALYAAGNFLSAGGAPAARIARWDGTGWAPLGTGLDGPAYDLHVHDDGSGPALYVTGQFTTAGGLPATKIARWNGAWSAVGAGLPGGAWSMTTFHDGSGSVLVVGGGISPPPSIAQLLKWNGSTWQELTPERLVGMPTHLFTFRAPGDDEPVLYGVGGIRGVGTHAALGIAAWHGCPDSGDAVCPGDGSGAACPCGNDSATGSATGCLSSLAIGGKLTASGYPNLTQDTFSLRGEQMPNSSALYFQGTTTTGGGAGVPFGDGLRCAGGTITRLGTKLNAGNASEYPGAGDPPVSVQGQIGSVGVRVYQVWYRNAAVFCTASTFNLTNAWQVTWGP